MFYVVLLLPCLQAEFLLGAIVAFVLAQLVLLPSYGIYVMFFVIATPVILRLRWVSGAVAMAFPITIFMWNRLSTQQILEALQESHTMLIGGSLDTTKEKSAGEILLHLLVAWAVSTLMGFLSDSSRRVTFVKERIAQAAAEFEVGQIRARILTEKELVAAQALAEARSMLIEREKASNEAKSEFISMLCHEIRTPLNGCLASAEMLLQTELDSDQIELANTVRVSGSILLSTVSNFLDYFKLEAGKPLDIVRTPLDVPSMVGDVHRIMQAMITAGGEVELLSPDIAHAPQSALGDPSRLCGILLNMYMNAAKFTRRGSIGLKVHIVPRGYRPRPPRVQDSVFYSSMEEEEEDRAKRKKSNRNSSVFLGVSDGDLSEKNGVDVAPQQHEHDSQVAALDASGSLSGSRRSSYYSLKMSVQDEGDGWMSTCSYMAKDEPALAAHVQEGAGNVTWVSFEVHDTGCGVQPRSLQALFHEYVQGDESEVTKPRTRSGTGLGLAICAKQVAFVDGVIGALSKPDVGSIFWFKVPMTVITADERHDEILYDAPRQQPSEGMKFTHKSCEDDLLRSQGGNSVHRVGSQSNLTTRLEQQWSASYLSEMANNTNDAGNFDSSSATDSISLCTGEENPTAIGTSFGEETNNEGSLDSDELSKQSEKSRNDKPLDGLHVLVAEDNLINRKVACRVLSSLGVTCHLATDGCEAVDIVKNISATPEGRLDLILMDVCMPVMGGIEATKAIRALESSAVSKIPIVAMTANAMEKDKEECLKAGMNDFLSKPVLREQLHETIRRICLARKS